MNLETYMLAHLDAIGPVTYAGADHKENANRLPDSAPPRPRFKPVPVPLPVFAGPLRPAKLDMTARGVTSMQIVDAVCAHYGCTRDGLRTPGRNVLVVARRRGACVLLRDWCAATHGLAAARLAFNNHTTVWHNLEKSRRDWPFDAPAIMAIEAELERVFGKASPLPVEEATT